MKWNRWILLGIFLVAFAVRAVGLFRGLESAESYHPDVAKQIRAVHNYLAGHYVWYTGSLAYDGYPYGLNHIDEWIIRVSWPIARAMVAFLQPGCELPGGPELIHLYYIVHALRVLYGLAALAIFHWTLRRLGIAPPLQWAWLLLAATAPLLSTVSHFGTGDIGTDLFVIAALAGIAHARDGAPRAGPFFACGVALGMAFSCKYHGILAGLAPGLYLWLAPITWRRRVQLGGALAAGVLLGFVALTPHVLTDFERTLKNIWLNFHYIKNYGIPPGFMDLPLGNRLSLSLAKNVPVVVQALGIGTLLLAILAALMALRRVVRQRDGAAAWDLAVVAMPFITLAVALAGKPALQPFHFSFLPLPFLLGAASIWRRPAGATKGALALLLLAAGENAAVQSREWFYWSGEDIKKLTARLAAELVVPPEPGDPLNAIATVCIEGRGLTIFRNRPQVVEIPRGKAWTRYPNDLLPATPWSASRTWIFADLPAFPRETRMVVARPGGAAQRHVVQGASATNLLVTLAAGSRESHVELRVDRSTRRLLLRPAEVRTLAFPAERGERIEQKGFAGRLHRVRATARGAPALIRFGPLPVETPPDDRRARKLEQAQFLSGIRGPSAGALAIARNAVLTPGRYAIEVDAGEAAPPMALRVEDQLVQHPARIFQQPLVWRDGVWRAEWDHSAHELFSILSLVLTTNSTVSLPWRIRPIAARPFQSEEAVVPTWTPAAGFGHGKWTLGNLDLPRRIRRGESLRIAVQLDATPDGLEALANYSAFLHLLDENRKQVFAMDMRLAAIPSRYSADVPLQDLGRIDLPPGRYEARTGIYDLYNTKRVKPDVRHERDRRIVAGTLVVE